MKARIQVAIPPKTKLMRLIREPKGYFNRYSGSWIVWLHTADFKYGTFLRLYDNGRIERVTCREGEGDDIHEVKPADFEG